MEVIKKGKIKVEILVKDTEKILNILWLQNIPISKVKKINITTLRLEIDYVNYQRLCEIVHSVGGKIRVLEGKGPIFLLEKMKKRYSIVIAVVIFFAIIYFLSTYIWAIDISVGKNVTPFEIREQLKKIGVSPGVRKGSLNEKEIEKRLESLNSEILWIKVRTEGSTLKVIINEKVNPPVEDEGKYGNLVADMDGQIKRIYTYSGRAAVKNNDIVKKGTVIIEGIDGNQGGEYVVIPSGIVIANTFYEKEMNIKISGTEYKRSGNKDSDIYIELFNKKIYLKKSTKEFEKYDKIEKSGRIFNEVIYYERIASTIEMTENEGVNLVLDTLEKSLSKGLKRDGKIVDKIVTKEKIDDEYLNVKVIFVVEQNIVSDEVVEY
ncbi:MAG: sporulation protein YqfD [Clostridium sp.]|nr:sporulation protein YqfD [Clostridium sp.]